MTNFAATVYSYNTIDGAHPGIDLGVSNFIPYEDEGNGNINGIPVYSGLLNGTVNSVGPDTAGYYRVVILLSGNKSAYYDHLDSDSIQVEPGDQVDPGNQADPKKDILAYLGDPVQAHLHLELRDSSNTALNPLPHFSPQLQEAFMIEARGQRDQNLVTYPDDYPWQDPLDQPPVTFK